MFKMNVSFISFLHIRISKVFYGGNFLCFFKLIHISENTINILKKIHSQHEFRNKISLGSD